MPEEPRENRETRERILRAAYDCLLRDGYERIRTRSIASVAGVTVGTLHYYFGTKEALLAETVRFVLQQSEQQLRAVIDAAPHAAAALEAALLETWRLVQARPGILRYDLVVRGFRDTAAAAEAREIYATYRRLTEEILLRHLASGGILPPGVTVEQLASHIVATVDGVVLHYLATGDEEAARFSLSLILSNTLSLLGAGQRTNKSL